MIDDKPVLIHQGCAARHDSAILSHVGLSKSRWVKMDVGPSQYFVRLKDFTGGHHSRVDGHESTLAILGVENHVGGMLEKFENSLQAWFAGEKGFVDHYWHGRFIQKQIFGITRQMDRFLITCACFMRIIRQLLFALTGFVRLYGDEVAIQFNRDVRPILSENCFFCHGFDEKNRKGGLRLDTFEGATADLGGYRAVDVSKPHASELLKRIHSNDPEDLMPPPESEKRLSDRDRQVLLQWIEQGAAYEEHWAWRALRRPNGPLDGAGGSAVDAFVERTWNREGVMPVQVAPPRERLRRLSFDLRGFPPSPEEVSQFQRDPSAQRFEGFREKWMSGLAYAEHQAVRWLDLVRWADTSGFVSDEPIASGAYRAWIIESFRKNQPFDEFSIEQLAGDLLPEPSDEQLIASGYNRILNTNCEAGAIEEEQLYKLKGEHVRALGTVWLGMTTGCAECHDHKFDPLSAKDYYSLAGFFDDLVEAGVYTPGDRREPLHYVHADKKNSHRDKTLVKQIARIQEKISNGDLMGMDAWVSDMKAGLKESTNWREFQWVPARLPAPRVLQGDFVETLLGKRLVRETRAQGGEFRRHHAAEFMTGFFKESSEASNQEKDAWYFDAWLDPENPPDMIGVQISHGDYGRLGWRTANYETYYWGVDSSGELSRPHAWSDPKRVKRMGDLPSDRGWTRFKIPFGERIKSVPGQTFLAVGMAWLQSGGRVGWGDSGAILRSDKVARLELGETGVRWWWEMPWNRQVYQRRVSLVASALRAGEAQRDSLQDQLVSQAFREFSQPKLMARLRRAESELFQLRARAMPVLVSRQAKSWKTTRVLNRGDYLDKSGPIVQPDVPDFLKPLVKSGEKANRLDLARWLFRENSALVARVYVNRLWHQFFGRGLSESLEDSGTQGDWPSHPELLDWLAVEFRESGWDRNHMVRLLTSSRAYQLSSTPTSDLYERDPENRLHARQGRFRLTAESIRDSALKVAGLLTLSQEVPRSSFFPYQPDPYWNRSDKVMFGSRHMAWNTSPVKGQYQRSLYTFWKRQNIHPTMLAFDAPTRQECTAKRNVTNTPGQALALLNDPMFVEAARVLAGRICEGPFDDDAVRLRQAFAIALQRDPSVAETDILLQLLNDQRRVYEQQPEAACGLLTVGQTPANGVPSELAAWTAVTRSILNLHEFLNRP